MSACLLIRVLQYVQYIYVIDVLYFRFSSQKYADPILDWVWFKGSGLVGVTLSAGRRDCDREWYVFVCSSNNNMGSTRTLDNVEPLANIKHQKQINSLILSTSPLSYEWETCVSSVGPSAWAKRAMQVSASWQNGFRDRVTRASAIITNIFLTSTESADLEIENK